MMGRLGGVLLIVLAAGVVWWLLAEEPQPEKVVPGDGVLADLQGEVGLVSTLRLRRDGEHGGDEAYDDISDPMALLPFLLSHKTSEAAGRRLQTMLGSDAERIRRFLRAFHPDAGLGRRTIHWAQSAVIQALMACGDVALDVLISELDDENATYRIYLDALIAGFGSGAGPAVPRLLRQLRTVPEDPPSAEAASVIKALGAIGPAAAEVLPDLYRWLDEGVTQVVEIASAGAMVRIGRASEATWDCCRDLLRTESWPRQQEAALLALAELGAEAAPIIPLLLECAEEKLLSESLMLRALKQIVTADKVVIDYLTRRFRETQSDQVAVGLFGQALVWLGERYVDLAFQLARERGAMAQAHLISMFRGQGDPPWDRILTEMEPAFSSKESEIRRQAYEQLTDEETLPDALLQRYVLRGLLDEDVRVRDLCADAAGELQTLSRELAATLLACLESEEEGLEIASSCLNALAKHPRWNTPQLFAAALELRRRYPRNWQSLSGLHRFARAHPKQVLELWAEGVALGHAEWRYGLRILVQVPPSMLSEYPEAQRILTLHVASRPKAHPPGILPR